MRALDVGGSVLLLALAAHGAVAAPRSSSRAPQYVVNQHRADAVKEAFQISWDGYYKHAFPHDSLRPISNGYSDDRCVSVDIRGRGLGGCVVL